MDGVLGSPRPRILEGHQNTVSGLAFSYDSRWLYSVSHDKTIVVWETKGNWDIRYTRRECHADWITCIAVCPSGEWAVTGGNDFKVKLWPTRDFRNPVEFKGHSGAITSVTFCNDATVASTSMDLTAKLWLLDGTEVTTLHGHRQAVNTISAYMNVIATGSDDGHVLTCQPMVGHEIATFTGHDNRVMAAAYGANHEIVSVSLDRSIKVWQADSDPNAAPHGYPISAVAVLGHIILSADRGGVMLAWTADQHPARIVSTTHIHDVRRYPASFKVQIDLFFLLACCKWHLRRLRQPWMQELRDSQRRSVRSPLDYGMEKWQVHY